MGTPVRSKEIGIDCVRQVHALAQELDWNPRSRNASNSGRIAQNLSGDRKEEARIIKMINVNKWNRRLLGTRHECTSVVAEPMKNQQFNGLRPQKAPQMFARDYRLVSKLS
jgi:hypothetical protein